jgi:hypothetical protein
MTINATVNKIFYSLDGKENATIPLYVTESRETEHWYATYEGYKLLTGLSEGHHQISVFYEGNNGIIGVGSVSFIIETIDVTAPAISDISIDNATYNLSALPLNFYVNETTSKISYSIDEKANITIAGNTTLTGLSEGEHSIIIYANDTTGNMGKSDIVSFAIETTTPSLSPTNSPTQQQPSQTPAQSEYPFTPPPSPPPPIFRNIIIALAIIGVTIIGLTAYFKLRKKQLK